MQFDQIPQSLCSPFQLLSAVAPSVVAPLFPSFFAAKQLRPISGQHSFWQLCSDRSLKPGFGIACAATPSVVVPESGQQESGLMPSVVQTETDPKIQNFSGNTIFAFGVATAVFQATADLVQAKALLQSARLTLSGANFAAVPGASDWRTVIKTPIPTPKWMTAATAEAEITSINANTAAKASRDHKSGKASNCISGNNPQKLACQKLHLYQPDNTRHLIPDDWLSVNQTAFNRAPAKMLFAASFDSLTQSLRPGLLSGLKGMLPDLPGTSGISAGGSKYVASGQSGVTRAHLSLSLLAKMNQQRQFTAAALVWCWPIFAVSRHQIAAKRALHALRMQNSRLQQQKMAVAQNYFLKASHCFDLKKFRLLAVSEIIFKFFKKIPKVIQNAADSLNKGNCNCSDLVLKVSLSQ